jgi:hypothetical protein
MGSRSLLDPLNIKWMFIVKILFLHPVGRSLVSSERGRSGSRRLLEPLNIKWVLIVKFSFYIPSAGAWSALKAPGAVRDLGSSRLTQNGCASY